MLKSQIDNEQSQNTIGNSMTVSGLLNGMIGGTILVLPLVGLSTGYASTFLVAIVIGFISYYTANIIIVHLGKAKNMQESILNHFNQNYTYMIIYALIIWAQQISVLFVYFNLICLQLQGIIGYFNWIGIAIAIALAIQILIVLYYDIGEETMGIGVVTIAAYIVFVTWTFFTAPKGESQVPAFGNPYVLMSTLLMAYNIHDFMAQNIIKNPKKQDYQGIVTVTFILGTLIYMYIAQIGAFSIVNRHALKAHPQTIQDYFQIGSIQVTIIQCLYLLHLFTVIPQHVKLSKIRFFNAVKIQNLKAIQWKQIVYLFMVLAACLVLYQLQVKLDALIAINGGVFGFLIVVCIPIFIHLQCILINKNCGQIQPMPQSSLSHCQCNYVYSSKTAKYLQFVLLTIIFIFGLVTMISSLIGLWNNRNS